MTTSSRRRALAVLGNPNSAASYAAGQEQAPRALRAAGLVEALSAGRTVVDHGDLPVQAWRPDPAHPTAQNWPDVVANLLAVREWLVEVLRDGGDVLLLGGNCTVALAAVAALRDVTARSPGLVYVDRHLDLNTPASVTDGALDWMGVAHALGLPGTLDALTHAFGPGPLLRPEHLVLLGTDEQRATAWEREQARRLGVRTWSADALATDPVGSATQALAALPDAAAVVNVDVDVLDFTDAPLAEDTGGRNTGPDLAALGDALTTVLRDPRPRVVCVCELNPTRSADDVALRRFVRVLADAFGAD